MNILSHRGFWITEDEKNTLVAFTRSFNNHFGVETDIRDLNGNLVISHDLPCDKYNDILSVEIFFELYSQIGNNLPLALNIKSDGLQVDLNNLLNKYNIKNYFVFDMSIPDTFNYLKLEMNVFARQSEYDSPAPFINQVKGIWLDEFNSHWINLDTIQNYIQKNKTICIVSPELHKRNYFKEWEDYNIIEKKLNYKDMFLCTDYPDKAKLYFK